MSAEIDKRFGGVINMLNGKEIDITHRHPTLPLQNMLANVFNQLSKVTGGQSALLPIKPTTPEVDTSPISYSTSRVLQELQRESVIAAITRRRSENDD